MDKEFEKLIANIKKYNPNANTNILKKAWEFATIAHAGQKRLSGEDYASHALETTKILVKLKMDIASIAAGFLHDTIEDGGVKKSEIAKEFGKDVADIVDGVTKVSHIRLRGSSNDEFVENLRKMFLAMARDLRVVLVKLADRLHNMRTLSALPADKQKKIARETLEIFAPLADRLGIGEVKGELEDLAFSYLQGKDYKKLFKNSEPYFEKAESVIKKMRKNIETEFKKEGVKATVQGRKKGLYSLWKKLERPEIDGDFTKIHDIVALRILTETVKDCYSALGIVHNLFKPVPHIGISDFIAQPKPNGYQSIHTKVFGPKGKIVEVQIRTYEMHNHAEHGVAAHWAYSDAKTKGKSDEVLENKGVKVSSRLSWVRELVDWQKEINDSKEYLNAVKFDTFSHRNFIFSPMGDVYDLPADATPIDFAYAVHTELGNYIKGAMVNGKIVNFSYKLKSGDVVEILKTKEPKAPSRDWLDFVTMTKTKEGIRKHLRRFGLLDSVEK